MSKRRLERLNELHWLKDEGVVERARKYFKILRYSMGLSAKEVGELAGVSRQTICNLENSQKRIEKTTVYGILFVMYDILRDGGFDEDENSARYYLPYEILIGMIFDGYAFQSEEDKVKFYLELKSLAYLYYHSDGSVTAVTCRDRLRKIFDEMLLIQQKEEFCLSY